MLPHGRLSFPECRAALHHIPYWLRLMKGVYFSGIKNVRTEWARAEEAGRNPEHREVTNQTMLLCYLFGVEYVPFCHAYKLCCILFSRRGE